MILLVRHILVRLAGATIAVVFGLSLICPTAATAGLATPAGPVILVVKGKIGETNVGDEAHFDREMLMALGMRSLTTHNPFETGLQEYEGVLFSDVLKAVDADGEVLVGTALDGYSIEIPVEDIMTFPVMLAMTWNGEVMRPRNKGPLWVVYPIDQYPELQDETYSVRTIWQLADIDVR
ncbi:MAG: molybdopterin-dependent oxidoreductase [Rhodospirillales bacterium]